MPDRIHGTDFKLHGIVAKLDLDILRAAFPSWRIGGSLGFWYALRGGAIVAAGPRSLLRCYLSAGTLFALAEKLCLQDHLDGLSDQELADVWQRACLPPTGQAS